MKTLPFISAVLLTAAFLLVMPRPAVALGQDEFIQHLEQAGYTVTIEPGAVAHPSLSVQGQGITAEKHGVAATVELLQYESQASLAKDWIDVDQQAPRSRAATSDFAGKVPIWNQDAVLALDYSAPNDPGTVQVVAAMFLGRLGINFAGLSPTSSRRAQVTVD